MRVSYFKYKVILSFVKTVVDYFKDRKIIKINLRQNMKINIGTIKMLKNLLCILGLSSNFF